MKRLVALGMVALMVTACENAISPGIEGGPDELGRPNIATTYPTDDYGFVDKYFAFLSPIVDNAEISGTSLNQNLRPVIELWPKDAVVPLPAPCPEEDPDCEPDPRPLVPDYACESDTLNPSDPINTFIPEVNADGTAYVYSWKTDNDPMTVGQVYRLCVKAQVVGLTGVQDVLLGWRDIQPDETQYPNSGSGEPYHFKYGRTIPVSFWVSGKALCYDVDGTTVIDCTVATFGPEGGSAVCDSAQCGFYVPEGAIENNNLATFDIRYVQCDVANQNLGTVDYLDIDIPQYPGCLTVTVTATYDWEAFGDEVIAAACRNPELLGPQDERLLLHIEDPRPTKDSVYALPTRSFPQLVCTDQFARLPADASVMDRVEFYAKKGLEAVVPWMAPPAVAAHAGFGGGTSLSCRAPEAMMDGPQGIISGCSSPTLAAGASLADSVYSETFRMVWALPSKIAALYEATPELGEPADWETWTNPFSAGPGTIRPAVVVTDECDANEPPPEEEEPVCSEKGVAGARVTFVLGTKPGDPPVDPTTVQVPTDSSGVAYAPWVLTTGGIYTGTANGIGIGLDEDLASFLYPGDAPASGAYQDHFGNAAVRLEQPRAKFTATVCSDKSEVLSTKYVDAEYGAGLPIAINVSSSAADTAYLYVTNDCYNVYFALEVPASEDLQNSLRIVFVDDLNNPLYGFDPAAPSTFSAVPALNDDMWFISRELVDKRTGAYQWTIDDWHVADNCKGNSQSECGAPDVTDNLIAPASYGAVYAPIDDPTATVYEFARCLPGGVNPDCVVDDTYDFAVPGVGEHMWIGFYLVLQQGKGAQGNTEFPDFRVFYPIKIDRK